MKQQYLTAQLFGGKKGAIGAGLSKDPQDVSSWHLIPSQLLGTGSAIRDQALAFGQYCKSQ